MEFWKDIGAVGVVDMKALTIELGNNILVFYIDFLFKF